MLHTIKARETAQAASPEAGLFDAVLFFSGHTYVSAYIRPQLPFGPPAWPLVINFLPSNFIYRYATNKVRKISKNNVPACEQQPKRTQQQMAPSLGPAYIHPFCVPQPQQPTLPTAHCLLLLPTACCYCLHSAATAYILLLLPLPQAAAYFLWVALLAVSPTVLPASDAFS